MKRSAWRYLWTAEDIRNRLLITFLLLVIYRLASHIPVPGVNREALSAILNSGTSGAGTLIGLLDLLSGGTVSTFSVLAMGVYPYITAQIILQLLVPIIPRLQKIMEEDPRQGREFQERWTYYLAVPMAALNAFGQIRLILSLSGNATVPLLTFGSDLGFNLPTLTMIITMTGGTMFAIWLGELISEYGIRNQGLSLIIFAGIVSQIPTNIGALWLDEQNRWTLLAVMLLVIILTVIAIVYVQQGRRNVPIMYPHKSQVFYAMQRGKSVKMPQPILPLMVNLSGMIPLIFASAILQFPRSEERRVGKG